MSVSKEARFAFGENWQRYAAGITEDRIREAEDSLRKMLGVTDLKGKKFLDVGSGSGMFSLAARSLGATVRSFDYDAASAACTASMRDRFFPDDPNWRVEEGSILDRAYVERLGKYDVVYAWGVLHHTGSLWQALDNVTLTVAPGGQLFVSIYNRQRWLSSYWSMVKRLYVKSPRPVQRVIHIGFYLYFVTAVGAADLLRGRNPTVRHTGRGRRGMSFYHDTADWVGGWPFEPAAFEEVVGRLQSAGFRLGASKTCGRRHGCNEFVFHSSAT